MDREYLRNRFYIRGATVLGIVNTVLSCLFNIVLVKCIHDSGMISWGIDKGTNHPPAKEN
jgi:hypothetical protein